MTESDTPADERRRREAATVTKELIYHRVLLPSAKRNANRPCTTDAATGVTHTYAEHLDEVAQAIGGLRRLGIGRGDRFAVMMAELTRVPRAVPRRVPRRRCGEPAQPAVRAEGTRLRAAATPAPRSASSIKLFAGLIDAVKDEAGLEHVCSSAGATCPHTMTYDDLLASGEPVIPDEGEETDPVVLMYTGGTTGLPKGVLLDQRAEMLNPYHVMMALPFGRDDGEPAADADVPRRVHVQRCSAARRRRPHRDGADVRADGRDAGGRDVPAARSR